MIAVFGASVTQQKNGYATKLRSNFNYRVRIFGHGGMHLNNAAICFIDRIIEERPAYCFLDWFSTGYNDTSDKTVQYIDTIIHKFSKVQCKLIFLFLPYKNDHSKQDFHSFCKSLLRKRGLSFIDINEEIEKSSLDAILRDDVHTTEYGSSLYSTIICNNFEKIKNCIKIPFDLPTTRYINVKKIQVNRAFESNIKLSGDCEVVGFLLTIGPHSGLLEVMNGLKSQTFNTWDRWCHYPRQQFNLSIEISGRVQVNILQTFFDTSSCRGQVDFTREKKKLIVNDIYYVGNSLKIHNFHDGHKIISMSLYKKRALGRINQFKNKIDRMIEKLW